MQGNQVAGSTPVARRDSKSQREAREDLKTELEVLTTERDRLRRERMDVQQELGRQHDRRVMPRLKVEKTNGVPSFVVGQRMMQRVHRRALDPFAGLDGVGAVFRDAEATARFARSHGVPVAEGQGGLASDSEVVIIAHAFKGQVGLVAVHRSGSVRHFDSSGVDQGDIRPAFTYDKALPRPDAFDDLCSWSAVLSTHIPRPYAQLYWRAQGRSVVIDHIDVDPDRIPVLTPEWDDRLGLTFDESYSRFLQQPYDSGGLANRVPGGTFTYEERA